MLGNKLKKRARIIADGYAGAVSFAVMFAIFAALPVLAADSASSAAAKADSSASVGSADTASLSAVSKDTSAPLLDTAVLIAFADTAPSPMPDSSALLYIDTVSSVADSETVSADASTVSQDAAGAIDEIELADLAFQDEFDQSSVSDKGFLRRLIANAFYIIFFIVCLAVIAGTIIFFLSRRDARRFLTTTRLSVLDKMVQKGCRYIETNYMNPDLSVSLVCRELVTGEAYLDALFMKEIGVGVSDFITQVRVDRVKKLLRKGVGLGADIDIGSACGQCGFADRASAEKSFAKLSGGVGIDKFLENLKNPLTSGQP